MWTDAGYAGPDTRSHSGLVAMWGGSIMVWRSSRQSVSSLSTAEADLNAAALGWQITEGYRLLESFGITVPGCKLYIDSHAALSITMCGANWRTLYFAVRARRLQEESERGGLELLHCPTGEMIADCLTKLSPAPGIQILHEAMSGRVSRNPPTCSDPQLTGLDRTKTKKTAVSSHSIQSTPHPQSPTPSP